MYCSLSMFEGRYVTGHWYEIDKWFKMSKKDHDKLQWSLLINEDGQIVNTYLGGSVTDESMKEPS